MKTVLSFALGVVMLALPQASAKTDASRNSDNEQDQRIEKVVDQPVKPDKPEKTDKKAKHSQDADGRGKTEKTAKKAKASDDSEKAPKTAHTSSDTKHSKTEASTSSDQTYVIKANDTFSSIAKAHHISVEKLISANPDVKPNALHPGQKIRLTSSATTATAKSKKNTSMHTEDSPSSASSKSNTDVSTSSTSRKSSTAKSTARDHHTDTPKSETTPVSNKNPGSHTPAPAGKSSEPHPVATESPAVLAAKDTPPSPRPEKKIRSVKIEGPITYGEFAAKHGTNTERLNDLNGLDLTHATLLAKGSELYIPAQP